MAVFVTKSKLDAYLAAAGLTQADAPLAARVPDLLAAINGAPYSGIARDTDAPALGAALGLTTSDVYKVANLAVAAGYLVKIA